MYIHTNTDSESEIINAYISTVLLPVFKVSGIFDMQNNVMVKNHWDSNQMNPHHPKRNVYDIIQFALTFERQILRLVAIKQISKAIV